MRSWKPVAALAAAGLAASAQARDVRHLQPSSKWVVNYADDSCSLGRSFGEGNRKVNLILQQFVPGDSFNIMFVGYPVEPVNPVRPIKATLQFGPNEEKSDETGLTATTTKIPAFILDGMQRLAAPTKAEKSAAESATRRNLPFDPPPIGPAREKAAIWLKLGKILRFDLVLETGPMDKPLEALRACAWDTVRSWGLDVEQQKHLTRKAWPAQSPYKWFSSDDYPRDMFIGEYEAIVHFRVLVDENGEPTSCHIQASTRPKEFDEVVCKQLMKRGKFGPALDAQGKPVRSYWRQTVQFRLDG